MTGEAVAETVDSVGVVIVAEVAAADMMHHAEEAEDSVVVVEAVHVLTCVMWHLSHYDPLQPIGCPLRSFRHDHGVARRKAAASHWKAPQKSQQEMLAQKSRWQPTWSR